MVNRGLQLLLLGCAIGLTHAGHAANISNPDISIQAPLTVGLLDSIMQEEILYKAQVARAKQQAELAKFSSTPSSSRTGVTDALPSVAWRRATANGWLAKFVFHDGTSMIAGRGQQLPGGMEVAPIASS